VLAGKLVPEPQGDSVTAVALEPRHVGAVLERDLARAVPASVVDHQGLHPQAARLRREAVEHRPDAPLLVQGGDDRDDRRELQAGVARSERGDGPIAHLWDV
jgi:hypothetical protein